MVQDLFSRDEYSQKGKNAAFLWEAIKITLMNFRTLDLKDALRAVVVPAKYFFSMMWYGLFFPRTRKKYGFRYRFKR